MVQFLGLKISYVMFLVMYGIVPSLALLVVFKPKGFCLSRIQLAVLTCLLLLYCLIGARVVHIILYYHRYVGRPFNLTWRISGISSMGAVIFGLLTVYIYSKITKKPFLEINDHFALGFPTIVFFVRVTCLTTGCCYGSPSFLPWAMTFNDGLLRHPTQAYEMIYSLAILITLLRFYTRLYNIRGATFFSVYFTYFFMRFFNESLRTDSPFIIGPLKLSHLAMITGMVLCGIGFYYAIFKKGRKQEFFDLLPKMALMFVLCLVIIGFIILSLLTIFFGKL